MSAAFLTAYWVQGLAGFIVLAEAVNKLWRTAARDKSRTQTEQRLATLKLVAWYLLALGAGGALVVGWLLTAPGWRLLQAMCTTAGFALLIVRDRMKE